MDSWGSSQSFYSIFKNLVLKELGRRELKPKIW